MPAPKKVQLPPRKNNNGGFSWSSAASGMFVGILSTWLIMSNTIDIKALLEPSDLPSDSSETKSESGSDIVDSLPIEFYKLLPSREERIPDHIISKQVRENSPDKPMDQPGKYRLQAGSFQKIADADSRRASILILGLNTHIEKVTHAGRKWHRVMLGPFESLKHLEVARRRLNKNNIDTIVVKLK